jgi:hypothetical protein
LPREERYRQALHAPAIFIELEVKGAGGRTERSAVDQDGARVGHAVLFHYRYKAPLAANLDILLQVRSGVFYAIHVYYPPSYSRRFDFAKRMQFYAEKSEFG